MTHWANESVFYHIYPLGFCGAPEHNDGHSAPVPRLRKIIEWIPHMKSLGVNALYLGPLFESDRHGYDTRDYYWVDRRLGDNDTLVEVVRVLHDNGIRVILDGVFNHVGRGFWAFRDLQMYGEQSDYGEWFRGLDFGGRSPFGDPFNYTNWNGHAELPKLNVEHWAVREHLLNAVTMWIERFDLDGLRLDVAECLDLDFLQALSTHCKGMRPDFWLLGEVIHGDYSQWANSHTLDSVTNYECYKGLYSSLVDANYFEIAYALNRQFGEGGLYRGLPLYAFADNHDVDRVASRLSNSAHLWPLYCLLFTMPGVPSIYYGSEWGIAGCKNNGSDAPLRPSLDLDTMIHSSPHPNLVETISLLSKVRRGSHALQYGGYRQLDVCHEQLGFVRQSDQERVAVLLNVADHPASFEVQIEGRRAVDVLNEGQVFPIVGGRVQVEPVPPQWARILRIEW